MQNFWLIDASSFVLASKHEQFRISERNAIMGCEVRKVSLCTSKQEYLRTFMWTTDQSGSCCTQQYLLLQPKTMILQQLFISVQAHLCNQLAVVRMAHVSGSKASASETGAKGEFKRQAAGYRSVVQKGGKYPPEGKFLAMMTYYNKLKLN